MRESLDFGGGVCYNEKKAVMGMKILNYGSCNVDYVYSLDHVLKVGETLVAGGMETFPGGKGLNQSVAVARAGAPVFHAGCIGEGGEFLAALLTEAGADLTYLTRTNEKNGHAVIQVSRAGDNSIFIYQGSNGMISKADIDRTLVDFSAGDLLLLQNEISNVGYLVAQAAARGMYVVLNPSPIDEALRKVDLAALGCIVLNEIEAADLTGRSDPYEALDYFAEHYPDLLVVLTLGGKGCVCQNKGERIVQKAFAADVVDTTAAGDTFTGYFVAGLYEGRPLPEILVFATAAASIAVSRKGAAPSIPLRQEVESRLGW